MNCYRNGGCGPYEMLSCGECPASKPSYLEKKKSSVSTAPATDAVSKTEINTVVEYCPYCENEVEMRWDTSTMGFKAFCPVCGHPLMLCDECCHTETSTPCDFDSKTGCCHRNPQKRAKSKRMRQRDMRVDTPLGAIIVRSAYDSTHPGVFVDLRRTDADDDMPLALVEFAADEGDLPDGQPNIITRVWGDAMKEEYTSRVVHARIEDYFRVEEVPC